MKLFRSQSAMEYLMTYGWAILIIAVVLGALFGLGFFNSANLAPKVGAGSCQVYRPNGPGSTSFINTEGTCNNELPQYVARFNGATSYIYIAPGPNLNYNPVTLASWVYPNTIASGIFGFYLMGLSGTSTYGGYLEISAGQFKADVCTITACVEHNLLSTIPSANQWYFVAETYDGSTQKLYVNGQLASSASLSITPQPTTNLAIGACPFCTGQLFLGSMANVQIYNSSLSANEIQALYDEGIGGVPLNLNNLVGWWPLNGNANDYSGNLNNANSVTSVVYTSSWTSGYSAP